MFKKQAPKQSQFTLHTLPQSDTEQLPVDKSTEADKQVKQEIEPIKEKSSFSLFKVFNITFENPGLITLIIAVLFFLTVIILAKC